MSAYEIITIFIGILTLLFTFGSFIVTFLSSSQKKNFKRKKKK